MLRNHYVFVSPKVAPKLTNVEDLTTEIFHTLALWMATKTRRAHLHKRETRYEGEKKLFSEATRTDPIPRVEAHYKPVPLDLDTTALLHRHLFRTILNDEGCRHIIHPFRTRSPCRLVFSIFNQESANRTHPIKGSN